jgi:hypothetical protein
MLSGDLTQSEHQALLLVAGRTRGLALRGAMLAHDTARTAL